MLAMELRGLGGVVSGEGVSLGRRRAGCSSPAMHASLLAACPGPSRMRKEDPHCAELDIGRKKCSRPEAKP